MHQPSLFEIENPRFDEKKTRTHGKIFILEKDRNCDKKVDINDLDWGYLDGDGDFRSEEIKKIRKESDFIISKWRVHKLSLWAEPEDINHYGDDSNKTFYHLVNR